MAHQKNFSRQDRVSEQIRRELAELIARELKDPRVGMVSITEVVVTADYAHAKVFFSSLSSPEKLVVVQEGLQKSAGFLRRELGRRIRIHTTPQLHFVYDESLTRGADLTQLIKQATAISGVDVDFSADAPPDA